MDKNQALEQALAAVSTWEPCPHCTNRMIISCHRCKGVGAIQPEGLPEAFEVLEAKYPDPPDPLAGALPFKLADDAEVPTEDPTLLKVNVKLEGGPRCSTPTEVEMSEEDALEIVLRDIGDEDCSKCGGQGVMVESQVHDEVTTKVCNQCCGWGKAVPDNYAQARQVLELSDADMTNDRLVKTLNKYVQSMGPEVLDKFPTAAAAMKANWGSLKKP